VETDIGGKGNATLLVETGIGGNGYWWKRASPIWNTFKSIFYFCSFCIINDNKMYLFD
jgi:hypothetical protein